MWGRHHVRGMVAVIDVGSNTVRLVVADGDRQILSRREMLHLGADVELHGSIPQDKLAAAARLVGSYADAARAAGAADIAVLITSPGRQAENGNELLDAIWAAAGCPTRILQRNRRGPARVRRCARGRRSPDASPGRRRRRRRWLGADRRRNAPRRSRVAALDRPRFAAPDQQAARRRPARTRGDRGRSRRGGGLRRRARSARASPRARRRRKRTRAQAHRRREPRPG